MCKYTVGHSYCLSLTGAVVIGVLTRVPAVADAQEGFVVIVLVPVKGRDPGESPLCVATHQAGGRGHYLPDGRLVFKERSHDLEEFPGAVPLEQLQGG